VNKKEKRDENSQPKMLEGAKSIGAGAATWNSYLFYHSYGFTDVHVSLAMRVLPT
jgi:hypothetical protein